MTQCNRRRAKSVPCCGPLQLGEMCQKAPRKMREYIQYVKNKERCRVRRGRENMTGASNLRLVNKIAPVAPFVRRIIRLIGKSSSRKKKKRRNCGQHSNPRAASCYSIWSNRHNNPTHARTLANPIDTHPTSQCFFTIIKKKENSCSDGRHQVDNVGMRLECKFSIARLLLKI